MSENIWMFKIAHFYVILRMILTTFVAIIISQPTQKSRISYEKMHDFGEFPERRMMLKYLGVFKKYLAKGFHLFMLFS